MKNFFRFCFFLIFIFILNACAKNTIVKTPNDLTFYSQDAINYVSYNYELSQKQSKKLLDNYLSSFYSPWNKPKINLNKNEVFWVSGSLLKAPGYGENLQKNPLSFTKKIYDEMQINKYPNAKIKAIIIKETSVRAAPTMQPRFNNASGFPFDRWQNSLIFAGTPVLITHMSKTKQYAHIQTSFVSGWVTMDSLALVSDNDIKKLKAIKNYVMPRVDFIPIFYDDKRFAMQARIGQILPLLKTTYSKTKDKKPYKFTIYAFSKNEKGYLVLKTAQTTSNDFAYFPTKLTPDSVARIINTMIGNPYGWGGYFGWRDCSAFVRDIFANFGLYLPRNSQAQVKFAKNVISLEKMKAKEKEKFIINNATPFSTLLWFKGHIMLYIGEQNGKAMVAHSAWSTMTNKGRKKYENMFGGVVVTSLHAGNENANSKSNLLIHKVALMSDLFDYMKELK